MIRSPRSQSALILLALPLVVIIMGWRQAAAQAPASFRHPGILVNQAQLDFVKSQVNANVDPWRTAFNAASSSAYASLSYTPHPWQTVECGPSSNPNLGCSDERNDALAAYTQALLWYITGNQAYAQNSVTIMNAWSSTLTGGHINSNAALQAGWTGSVWPEAAEIIRYTYNGWSASDIAAFQNMLTTQYVPNLINGAPCKNGNWELIITEALMNISIFNEDSSLFNRAVSFWRGRVPAYMYLPSDGPTPVPPPNCGANVNTYWNQTTFVDGLAQETSRDFGHTFWGLAASVNTAETAFQQGVNLYAENAQRIVDSFEFHNSINNGNPPQSGVNVGPIGGNGPTMEISYNHFHNRLGMNMPQTAQQIAAKRPTGANYFLAWETLTHAQVGWIGLQNTSCVTGSAGDGWHNTALSADQTGTFTVEYDATPSASPLNAAVALSQGAQTAYAGFATLTRFNPSGAIDARNGGAYAALSTIPFSGGVSYHFRLVINMPAHTYSIYVTPAGGTEQTVGENFAFRTEQNAVA